MLIILLTIFLTLVVLGLINRRLYLKYKSPSVNLWFLHPLFLFNGVIVLTFFIPYIFQLFFSPIIPGLDLFTPQNIKDLVILCLIFIFFNLFLYVIEEATYNKRRVKEKIKIVFGKPEFILLIILFTLVLFSQVAIFCFGGYYSSAMALIKGGPAPLRIRGLIYFFDGVIKNFVWLALSILYLTKFSQSLKYKIFFWVLIIGNVIWAFPSGSKLFILKPILFFIFCYLIFAKKNFWKVLIIGIILLGLTFSFYDVWRNYVFLKLTERSEITYQQFLSTKPVIIERGYTFFILNGLVRRLDSSTSYLILTDFYPEKFEFIKGRSYLPILFSGIPRVLLLEKPMFPDVNEIGRKTGLIAEDDFVTSPGLGWWAEAYINFGYWGILFVLLIMGIFYQLLFGFWLRHKNCLITSAFYLTFLFFIPLTIQEVVGGIFMNVVNFLYVVLPISIIVYVPFLKFRKQKVL